MYRNFNTYATGSKIVKGIYYNSSDGWGGSTDESDNLTVYVSSVLDPNNKKELDVDIIQSDTNWYFTTPFKLWFTGEYIITWKHKNDGVIVKQIIAISDKITNTELKIKSSVFKV